MARDRIAAGHCSAWVGWNSSVRVLKSWWSYDRSSWLVDRPAWSGYIVSIVRHIYTKPKKELDAYCCGMIPDYENVDIT